MQPYHFVILFCSKHEKVNGPECLAHILKLKPVKQREPLKKKPKGTTENSFKMMKHVSMDVLYFSAYGDFFLHVNTAHTVEQPCVDVAD